MLAAESSIMLDWVKTIVTSTTYLEYGYSLTHIDNEKVNRNINIKIDKTSTYSSDSRSVFSKIKELLKVTKIIIDFKHIKTRSLSDDINQ